MANSLSASFQEIWAREQQEVFYKKNVAMALADMSFNSDMKYADTLNRTYRSSTYVQTYTPGTAITIDDLTDTNEQLSVNRKFATGFYVDDFDQIQDKYDVAAKYGKDYGVYLSNQVDADFLGEVANATSTVDDGTLGGTSGNGIALTTSNVLSVFSAARRKLGKLNVALDNLWAVVSPEVEEVIVQYRGGRDTDAGDRTLDNGYMTTFLGFKVHVSNQTYGTAVLSLATQPTNNDTVTINGVTFTFVSSIGTTAGNVLIGANVDVTRASLAALINAPTTTNSTQVALSTQNARLFANATATNDNAANTLTVTFKGVGTLTVSKSLTDPTDTWTTTSQIQHNMFGAGEAPTIVMQSEPTVKIKDVPDKLGKNVLNGVLYGVKTFADNAKRIVDVKIKSSSF